MPTRSTENQLETHHCNSVSLAVDEIIALAGTKLTVASPLGIGKSNYLLNALWQRARDDSSFELDLFTALSLALPMAGGFLEKRFLLPFLQRHFGEDYPDLLHIQDQLSLQVPANASVAEFYMQSGNFLKNSPAQRNYTSSNYTHAARDMADRGVNVIVQMVGLEERDGKLIYSLGSNPDTTQDLLDIIHRRGSKRPLLVAVVNRNMPFMTGAAERSSDFFDLIVDDPETQHTLFAPPIGSVGLVDHSIGLHASTLIADGGTLQIGIGSLSDALVHALCQRHTDPDAYQQLLINSDIHNRYDWLNLQDLGQFSNGLYAASEMFMDGFMHLYKAGILKRKVWPDAALHRFINSGQHAPVVNAEFFEAICSQQVLPAILDKQQLLRLQRLGIVRTDIEYKNDQWLTAEGQYLDPDIRVAENRLAICERALLLGQEIKGAAVLHAAFFLGSANFYAWLRSLQGAERELFQMTAVSQINELYGGEELDRAQRVKARFLNTTMKVTLLGAAASDGLDNNQVVSGVGGQYNFVAMAHALPDSRSVLMLRSTHGSGKSIKSNIVWTYPYDTIPRHLRDVVITEYGIAMLRGKSDEDCIKAMICIADSRFQADLLSTAKQFGKLDQAWSIPAEYSENTPAGLKTRLKQGINDDSFPEWPFGSDFSTVELRLIKALGWLKKATKSRTALFLTIIKAVFRPLAIQEYEQEFERMHLLTVSAMQEKLYQRLLSLALQQTQKS